VILDTSALMAILRREPERDAFTEALSGAARPAISAATLVELVLVSEGRGGPSVRPELDLLLSQSAIEVVPFTAEHAGKGRHPAGLNLGDCFAYALAQSRGEPLLFKGTDFAQTDVKAAV
jgi:ribonuclease VapC